MDVERLKRMILEKDEENGYCEREAAIDAFLRGEVSGSQAEKYVSALEFVLARLSTPVDKDDLLVGRMVEGPLDCELEAVPAGGKSHAHNPFRCTDRNMGHCSMDYDKLVRMGLRGVEKQFADNARTAAQQRYAALVSRAVNAIGAFAARYADAAAAAGNARAAAALRVVPMEPARDFFSAVQGIWLVEMVLSCVVGGRDYGYSRLDLTLLPYYDEMNDADNENILTSFMLRNNDLGGMGSELHVHMPVPCAATNIYCMLGGVGAEDALGLDLCFLRAAQRVQLPQPVLALRQSKDSPQAWKEACAAAAQKLHGQVSLYNDDALIPNLIALGLPAELAQNYTMSGCNRAEYPGHQSSDAFDDCAKWFLEAFYDENVRDMDGLLQKLDEVTRREIGKSRGNHRAKQDEELRFNLESLLFAGCAETCCDMENGGMNVETYVHNLSGIATVADSLAAVQTVVFEEQRVTLDELREIVRSDFAGQEALRLRLANRCPKYGNDDEAADKWARAAGEIFAKAVVEHRAEGCIHIPSFYSLYFHQRFGKALGATPDGRRAGQDVSENQSPVYGCDKMGPTALLHSVSALPQRYCGAGGLNLRLAKPLPPEQLAGLVSVYFDMGGVNIAPNVLSRETLLAAREHPEQYRSLAVRIVGYSEIYLRLPEDMQIEILNRTELAV